jgi:hypothetical protein
MSKIDRGDAYKFDENRFSIQGKKRMAKQEQKDVEITKTCLAA